MRIGEILGKEVHLCFNRIMEKNKQSKYLHNFMSLGIKMNTARSSAIVLLI